MSSSRSRSGTPPLASVTDTATADDLFNLAAPPLQQPLVARLVPLSSSLSAVELHQGDGCVVLGRSKDLDEAFRIEISDKISARHCELAVDAVTLQLTVKDISTNGTYVNGTRLEKGVVVVLGSGDSLSLTRPTPSIEHHGIPKTESTASEDAVAFVVQRVKHETSKLDVVQELTCSICRGVFHRPCSVLPCMHVFCSGCISGWITSAGDRPTCPECREPVTQLRPTHRLQSLVDQLLFSDPSYQRPVEELQLLMAADVVPPGGMKVGKRQRHASDDEASVSTPSSDDVDSSDDRLVSHTDGPLRHRMLHYNAMISRPHHECDECRQPSPLDGYHCPEGGPHIVCHACATPFAERPLCGRPQRCHICHSPYCNLYRSGGCSCNGMSSFQPYKLHPPPSVLPSMTFGGNTIEQSILTTYLASHQVLLRDVWQTTLSKLADGDWVPNITSLSGPLTIDSPVCAACAERVFAALLFHYRRAIPSAELPSAVTERTNCWYGIECRTQFHSIHHAQRLNHICYQEKRKE